MTGSGLPAAGSPAGLPPDLPIAGVLDRVVAASRSGAVVVTAPPGSGKTMLVPAAVLDDLAAPAKVELLQPRRLAARAVAAQIARLRGGSLGDEVGYRVRFDARAGRDTRLVVETTGILLRRLLDDVTLEGTGAVVLDEFHERSFEMDLILGLLVRLRQSLRPDLRVIVMSATLAAEPVARLLADESGRPCPVVTADGRLHPVETTFLRHGDRRGLEDLVATAVAEALRTTPGHVLVFLPGVGEIRRCEAILAPTVARQPIELLPLYGDLPPEAQDRVLAETAGASRKVILATNVAETSLTIPGVTAVVDSGLARQSRVSPATGLPRLELVPISQASAAQRAGRAGRTAAGRCLRLWDEAAHVQRPAAELPEVLRGDLAGPLLQLIALGEAGDFPWLDPPPPDAVERARTLLGRLGAITTSEPPATSTPAAMRDDRENDPAGTPRDRLTPLGADLVRLPAHPRLARLLLAGAAEGVLREASIAAALLSERDPFRTPRPGTGPRDRHKVRSRCDLHDRVLAVQAFHAGLVQDDPALDPHPGGARSVLRTAEQFYGLVASAVIDTPLASRAADPATALRAALLTAFPDRLVRLRPGSQDRGTLVGGRGVRLTTSRLRGEPFCLAIDLDDAGGEAGVRLASAVEREWLDRGPLAAANLRTAEELLWHPSRRQVEARRQTAWLDLVLDETPVAIGDETAAAAILAREAAVALDRLLPAADTPAGGFLARCRWLAGAVPDLGLPSLDDAAVQAALPHLCLGLRSFDDLARADWLGLLHGLVGHQRVAEIERLAPASIALANGRRGRLAYEPGSPPVLAARIQELFGLRQTPRVADGRAGVLLHLLGPNHRPQQVTSDLAGFWARTYPQVRQELKRRYPKHAWPEDPLQP
jgi:ATP-dependent helicase HrpB